MKRVYIAHPDFVEDLTQELNDEVEIHGNLIFSDKEIASCFAQDIWLQPKIAKIESIGQAAKILREEKVLWYPTIVNCARRTLFIAEKLPLYKNKPLPFPLIKPIPKIGCFALLDENTLIYSAERSKPVPNGEFNFQEDKYNPPNRAYLKLWEALTLLNRYPKRGDNALDLGASPGGWTYVLQSFGAKVTAVDKAPLVDSIAKLPGVTCLQQSAFSLEPDDFTHIDWLVCDVACYPERLYQFVQKWMASGKVKQFICTVKLQGKTDFAAIRQFQEIPNSTVVHLYNNKHEVTWFWPAI